jgi:hypothetical protein
MGVFIGGVSELHHWFEVVTHQTLVGRPATQLGLHQLWASDTPCTDPPWHIGKAEIEMALAPSRQAVEVGPGKPHFGSVGPGLCATSSPRVILSTTMHGFLSIWCFSIIRCSWNGRSTKLMELISNKHLSSISCMNCRYVGGKYIHLMTANNYLIH